jgi:ATP-dependent exoDNAse (exonuclease V) beta subunit
VAQDVGLRQQRILEADAAGVVAAEGERAHAQWQETRRETLERGARPSLNVSAVTALAAQRAGTADETDAAEIRVEEVPGDRETRPHGMRFGTLVHAALAAVDLGAGPEVARAATRRQGRIVGASEQEVEAAASAVVAALDHPLLRRAARSTALRRETPVLLKLAEGGLAEGVVDLAFREEGAGGWTVVDFKTDRDLEPNLSEYAAQVRLYAEAIARATGESARGVLLMV